MSFIFGGGRPSQPPTPKTLPDYMKLVEGILKAKPFEIDTKNAFLTLTNGQGWRFMRGSALIHVILNEAGDKQLFFQVYSPIMHLPNVTLFPLYRRLLEWNLQLTSATFGISGDVVYLFHERPLSGLNEQDARYIIDKLSKYADEYDDKIINEFGGRKYSQV